MDTPELLSLYIYSEQNGFFAALKKYNSLIGRKGEGHVPLSLYIERF